MASFDYLEAPNETIGSDGEDDYYYNNITSEVMTHQCFDNGSLMIPFQIGSNNMSILEAAKVRNGFCVLNNGKNLFVTTINSNTISIWFRLGRSGEAFNVNQEYVVVPKNKDSS